MNGQGSPSGLGPRMNGQGSPSGLRSSRVVLGLESGADHLAAAIVDDAGVVAEARFRRGPDRSDALLALVAGLLERAGLTLGDVALIAVPRGPGSFTGIRVGLSLAQGLSLGSGVPVWPVSSLAALAMNAVIPDAPVSNVLALLDARRGEVYAGLYRLRAGRPPLTLLAPRAATCEVALAAAREALPEGGERMTVLGSGAVAYGVATPLGDARDAVHVASALTVAELARREWAEAGWDLAAAPPVDPAYLRKSEAEIAADLKEGRAS